MNRIANLAAYGPRLRVGLRALAISAGTWGGVALALMAAYYVQGLRVQRPQTLEDLLLSGALPFLPLFLFSFFMVFMLHGREERWLSWSRLAWVAPILVSFLLAALLTWEGLLDAMRVGKPLSWVLHFVTELPPFFLWTDLMVVCAAVLLHVAMLSWDVSRRRKLALSAVERRNVELRLEMLQGQLEPHFLFNALNTISSLVRAADRERATRALAEVSDLLRHALRASQGGWLSVQDEIDFSKHYLHLQQMRFEDRLRVIWKLDDEDWGAIACPPMLMQPLLENAVKHGLESHENDCEVVVELVHEESCVSVRVSNPMPPKDASNPGHGVGLQATRERLQLLFGERATFAAGESGNRFVASLRIPVDVSP